jgi:L-asparaginase
MLSRPLPRRSLSSFDASPRRIRVGQFVRSLMISLQRSCDRRIPVGHRRNTVAPHGAAAYFHRRLGTGADMCASPTPRVRLLTTGGTIASTPDPDTGAMRASTSGDDLVAAIPGLADLADVEVEDVALVNSWDVTLPLMADLARRVAAAAADGVAGVVVTHGTDTLEETAFALDLLHDAPLPVVVTGAMRGGGGNPALTDGPRNLLAAVRVAAAPAARDLGCVTVLNEEVHAARWVTKLHTTALHTFASPGAGPVGHIDDRGLALRQRPPSGRALRTPNGGIPDPAEPIPLLWAAAGIDAGMVEAAGADARGLVLAGSGSGNVPAPWLPAIRALLQRDIPVVLASRCQQGRVVPTYGGDGGGRVLVDAGVLPVGALSAVKARIALAFGLGAGLPRDDLGILLDR